MKRYMNWMEINKNLEDFFTVFGEMVKYGKGGYFGKKYGFIWWLFIWWLYLDEQVEIEWKIIRFLLHILLNKR